MTPLRKEIYTAVNEIQAFDAIEMEHLAFTKKWIESSAGLFRTEKPATPDPHLVAYFALIDEAANKMLLVDHKKAGLWLPAGGHVEPDEHPKTTVVREAKEELGIEAEFLIENPCFLTVTKTVGSVYTHTDISLWYLLKGNSKHALQFDPEEFHQICWFSMDELPLHCTDPHLERFVNKLKHAVVR